MLREDQLGSRFVSVVIRKCAPLFNYLAKSSFTNPTSIILSNILFTYIQAE